MRQIPIHDHADLSPRARAELEAAVRGLRTLGDVLAWARGHRPPLALLEIVTQDEYTHDVVVTGSGSARYLAFDTT